MRSATLKGTSTLILNCEVSPHFATPRIPQWMLFIRCSRSASPFVLVTIIRRVSLQATYKMASTGPFASASTSSTPFSSKPRTFPPPSHRRPHTQAQSPPKGQGQDDAWKSALTRYAKSPDPASLPKEEVLHWDEQTITIYDGYEKAKYHFLCLPRIPFRLKGRKGAAVGTGREEKQEEQVPTLRATSQKGGADSGNWRSRGPATPPAPAPASSTETPKPILSTAGGKLAFGTSSKNAAGNGEETVPPSHLASLSDLLRSPYAGEVLSALEKAAYKVSQGTGSAFPASVPVPNLLLIK